MSRTFAEFVVAAIVVAWLVSVLVALIDPSRADTAGTFAPIMGTVAGGAIAALALARRRNGSP